MRFVWRSPKLFEEPGWYLILTSGKEVCLLPVPKGK